MDFNKKGKGEFFNDKLLFKALGIFFLLVVIFFIVEDVKIYQKKQKLIAQIADYKKQIQEIQKNSQNLKTQIANADNPDYLEKIAYEQLGQQKPGEKQIIFVKPEVKSQTESSKQKSFWGSWFGWIKSKF